MVSMTNRTIPLTDGQILRLAVDVPADVTGLRGWEIPVYLHYLLAVPFGLVGEHSNETTPTCISDRLREVVVSLHALHVEVFNADNIIPPYKGVGAFVQIVSTAIGYLLVDSGYLESLVFVPSAAFFLAGEMPLCYCELTLISSRISVVSECLSFGGYKQVFQPHIHAYSLTGLLERSHILLFREHGYEIFSARCLGYDHLADLALYRTMNTTSDTLSELGYEEPAIGDGCVLRNGETISRVLGFEVGKLGAFQKEIGIGYLKATYSKLQGLGVDLLEPYGFRLSFQLGQFRSLSIVTITLTREPILLLALIEKVVVHETRTAEMPRQHISLLLVRVQTELVCPVNLSHNIYKINEYLVNYKYSQYIRKMNGNKDALYPIG